MHNAWFCFSVYCKLTCSKRDPEVCTYLLRTLTGIVRMLSGDPNGQVMIGPADVSIAVLDTGRSVYTNKQFALHINLYTAVMDCA
jgi:hypothetical protein